MSRATWRRCYDGSNRHDTTLEGEALRCRNCGQVATVAAAAPETPVRLKSSRDPRIEYIVRTKADGTASCSQGELA